MARKPLDTRADQEKAARQRREDGKLLLADAEKHYWRGGMYLLGYAIECRLKSYMMGRLKVNDLAAAEDAFRAETGDAISLTSHHRLWKYWEWAEALGLGGGTDGTVKAATTAVFRWDPSWRYSSAVPSREQADAFRDGALLLYNHIISQT